MREHSDSTAILFVLNFLMGKLFVEVYDKKPAQIVSLELNVCVRLCHKQDASVIRGQIRI